MFKDGKVNIKIGRTRMPVEDATKLIENLEVIIKDYVAENTKVIDLDNCDVKEFVTKETGYQLIDDTIVNEQNLLTFMKNIDGKEKRFTLDLTEKLS